MSNYIFRITIIFFVIFTNPLFGKCNFKTSDRIDDLNNIKKIQKIKIDILDNRGWSKNALFILKDKNSTIQVKNKKNFKSNIKVIYDFGFCDYKGNVRISGDKKDHLELENGNLKASLDVILKKGNINSSTKFKLFLPKTRNSNNEIFSTLLLKELGFIAPSTFNIDVQLNGLQYNVLFQEKAVKELLEKNSRVEGPIFEGDEEILWKNRNKYSNFRTMQLEKLSGSRLTNTKWATKNINTTLITLESFIKLQKAYFDYSLSDTLFHINPNFKKDNIFLEYDLTLMTMNGFHGLRPHNRKYYYNTQRRLFEPIYYDGGTRLEKNILENNLKRYFDGNDAYFYSKSLDYKKFENFLNKIDGIKVDNFIRKYQINSKISLIDAESEVKNNFKIVKENFKNIKNFFNEYEKNSQKQIIKKKDWFKEVEKLEKKYDFNQRYIFVEDINKKDQKVKVSCKSKKNCGNKKINFDELIYLMERNIYDNKRAIIFDSNINFLENDLKITKNIFNGKNIISSKDAEISFNRENKSISLIQKFSYDWFLLKDQEIKNIDINFIGNKDKKKNTYNFSGISKNGLTGCLTFYNVKLYNVNLTSKNSKCEDSINLILSNGKLNNVIVENSDSDGLDFDFSEFQIEKINVKNSLNDCLDFSFGKYYIKKVYALMCGDKGISVGEKSNLKIDETYVKESNTGVSSKDSSKVLLANVDIEDVENCLSANNKKQEFGGAMIKTNSLACKNYQKKLDIGLDSSILVYKN